MLQRLDLSPQSKVQLARAIDSLWSIEKGSAGQNRVGTAAVDAKSCTPSAIKHVAHKCIVVYDLVVIEKMDL